MAHRLKPKSGVFLPPKEVLRRLRLEFEAVEASAEQGREHVRDMLTYILKLKEGGKVPVDEVYLAHLQDAEEGSILLIIADDRYTENDYLRCCAIPEEPLFFGYSSGQHQMAAQPLLERCARALEYEIELL